MAQPLHEHIVDFAQQLRAELVEVRREISELSTNAAPARRLPATVIEVDFSSRRRLGVSR